jgi:hypothetical protein
VFRYAVVNLRKKLCVTRHARNPVHEAKYSRRNNGASKSSCKNKTAPLRHAARPRAQKRW